MIRKIIILFIIIMMQITTAVIASESLIRYNDEDIYAGKIKLDIKNKKSLKKAKNKIELEYFADNNLYTFEDLIKKDYKSPYSFGQKGEIFFNSNNKITMDYENFYLGYFQEHEEKIIISSNTVELLGNIDKKENIQKVYPVALNEMSQTVEGVFFGGEFWHNKEYGLSLLVNAKLLEGKNLTSRKYEGEVFSENDKLNLKGSRMVVFSDMDDVLSIQDENFYSAGFSTDVELIWDYSENKIFSLSVNNLFSRIYWYNVYTEGGKYDTDNIVRGEDGYLHFVSSYQGVYDFKDYVTSLTPEIDIFYKNGFYKAGFLHHQKLCPYFLVDILKFDLYNKPLKIKAGFFSDYYNFKVNYSGIKLSLMSREFNLKTTGGAVRLSFNWEF